MMVKLLQCLKIMEYMDIGILLTEIFLIAIAEFIMKLTMVEVDLGIKRPATIYLTTVEFIILLLTVEVEIGIKRPATLPLEIMNQELMLTV